MLRARPLEEKIQAAQVLERHLVPWLSRGIVKPVIDRVFPFAKAAEALDRLERRWLQQLSRPAQVAEDRLGIGDAFAAWRAGRGRSVV